MEAANPLLKNNTVECVPPMHSVENILGRTLYKVSVLHYLFMKSRMTLQAIFSNMHNVLITSRDKNK